MTEPRKNWSLEDVVKFIDIYRQHGNLWNEDDPNYKNRVKKADSLREMAFIFDTSPGEIERKMKNINCQYRRERRTHTKMEKDGVGHTFRSKWFGYDAMSFLHGQKAKDQLNISLQDSISSGNIAPSKEFRWVTSHSIKNEDDSNVEDITLEQPCIKNETDISVDSQPSTSKRKLSENTPTVKNKRQRPADDDETPQAFQLMKYILDTRETNSERDEYDIFGELVVQNIRKLNTEYAKVTVQNKINNLLYEARLGYFDFPSMSANDKSQAS